MPIYITPDANPMVGPGEWEWGGPLGSSPQPAGLWPPGLRPEVQSSGSGTPPAPRSAPPRYNGPSIFVGGMRGAQTQHPGPWILTIRSDHISQKSHISAEPFWALSRFLFPPQYVPSSPSPLFIDLHPFLEQSSLRRQGLSLFSPTFSASAESASSIPEGGANNSSLARSASEASHSWKLPASASSASGGGGSRSSSRSSI